MNYNTEKPEFEFLHEQTQQNFIWKTNFSQLQVFSPQFNFYRIKKNVRLADVMNEKNHYKKVKLRFLSIYSTQPVEVNNIRIFSKKLCTRKVVQNTCVVVLRKTWKTKNDEQWMPYQCCCVTTHTFLIVH